MTKDLTAEQVSRRARYEKPRLLMFGDVSELTHALGSVGSKNDGGTTPNNKTS